VGSETIPVDDPAVEPDLIESSVRVATWNIWWRFGPWETRQPLVVEELRRIDADVVCLQEVWGTDDTTAGDLIADELGYECRYAGLVELSPGVRFGNAVLSRWPITDHEHRALPALDEPDEHRLVLRADVDGPRGPLQVFCTHLNWRFDHSHVRQAQVQAIASFVQESRPREYPPVVCGDFNATPHSDEIRTLTGERPVADDLVLVDAWRHVHAHDPGFTWNNENPFVAAQLEATRRLDYVFAGWFKSRGAGNPVSAELFGTEPVGGVHPSDHYGVVAELRY
jgi:endonuclease/exonuclease/phosphatase family metal-dependent hydrolase